MAGFARSYTRHTWWSLLVRGVIAVVFGLAAMAQPEGVLRVFVRLFGVFLLVVGILATVAALTRREQTKIWSVLLVPGVIALIVGIVSVAVPSAIVAVAVYLIAVAVLLYGTWELYGVYNLRRGLRAEWGTVLVGVVSLLFGIFLLAKPLTAGAMATRLAGLFVFILGILWLMLAGRALKRRHG